MHFYKLFAAGQDYIYFDDKVKSAGLEREDIIKICDPSAGVGATGIIVPCSEGGKKVQIKAFDKNGDIMRDLSTASICASLGLKITTGADDEVFLWNETQIFTYLSSFYRGKYLISCDIKNNSPDSFSDIKEKRTELGNRILTLTPVVTTDAYAVHFTQCLESLNFMYLAEKTVASSAFGKKFSLILAEKNGVNSFEISSVLEKGRRIIAYAGGFAAVAFAVCRTHKAGYGEEIRLFCDGCEMFAVCKDDKSVVLHTEGRVLFEGNILLK